MSTQTLTATRAVASDQPLTQRFNTPHPIWLGLASGCFLWLSFPPAAWGPLAWAALVPLFLLIKSERSRLSIYFGAWLGGFTFWMLALNWIVCIDAEAALGWVTMALVLSLFWPLFLAIARPPVRTLKLPLMIVAPAVWVALEYVRAYFLTGFPWYYLAHSQYKLLPLIQISDITGSLGVSLLMAVANALIVDVLTLPLMQPTKNGPKLTRSMMLRFGTFGIGLVLTLAYGALRMGTAKFEPGPRVGLIQSSIMQRYRVGKTAEDILAEYEGLIARAARTQPTPDLIVWPETSYPYGFVKIDSSLPADQFAAQVKSYDDEGKPEEWKLKREGVDAHLHTWVDTMKIPMMVGSTTYDFAATGFNRYNSAILFEPGKSTIQSYHKLHLVPFGEYVPLLKTFPWLTALTPYRNGHVPSLTFGGVPSWFEHGKYRYATAICFEDTVPQVTRRLFAEVPDSKSPDVLLNLSNDGWFTTKDEDGTIHGSSEHEMHLAVSVFRSIEHRAPLARAANTGISAVVDGNGRVIAQLASGKSDILVAEVPLDPRTGLYTSVGDWLGLSCLATTIGLIPLTWYLPRRRLKSAQAAA